MKRVLIHPGTYVLVSSDIARKASDAFKSVSFSRVQATAIGRSELVKKNGGALIGARNTDVKPPKHAIYRGVGGRFVARKASKNKNDLVAA